MAQKGKHAKGKRKAPKAPKALKAPKAPKAAAALKKAVPPPDNPLLRHQAEELRHDPAAQDKEQALARARALQQTRRMPAADPTDDEPSTGES